MKALNALVIAFIFFAFLSACNNGTDKTAQAPAESQPLAKIAVPAFNADSAYYYIDKQVAFGPRIPGSAAQKNCAAFMQQQLAKLCDTVYEQKTTVKGGDGKMLPCINLIGVIHPKATRRILFLTHWDSRPWADMDTKDKDKPILAADDAGSGVGVLLAVAQAIKTQQLSPDMGIDILFTDVEDYGKDIWGEDSYCLGTQYWAHHPHVANYKAIFGVLLDMVGAQNARFPLEGSSARLAGSVQQLVWDAASQAGFSSYFVYSPGADITDDHIPVNRIANIPTIDVINLRQDAASPFAPHWHTHMDNMQIIDRNTLKAVGQSLLQLIYSQAANK